jgi:hypothetical protein
VDNRLNNYATPDKQIQARFPSVISVTLQAAED